ncbi:transcriptional repressor [Alisedimentitalea sp. MJ-SS2]|uniref:Fur family transcriptional regulator n=1 Tax=Aliisedimentitalea sp. MJ-SS2 TaxID=3049795 RepID=UPI00290D0808|nr:transcriptional repressor [Alisedimentitalea sp. MJ-SS2]MDU8925802.1 transcriptional repressor [Alisedimentitalea sp. MJ-SS2]
MTAIGFEHHDHAACVHSGTAVAAEYCAQQGLQFTAQRRRVLEILLEEHRALGAYDILDRLREEGLGAQPPVAYRALDFLTSHGFAHKIERLNAFIACAHMGQRHAPAFLICRDCGAVAEAYADPLQGDLGRAARDAGFSVERAVIEVEGLCPHCQESPAK